jgi:hypothetical protein
MKVNISPWIITIATVVICSQIITSQYTEIVSLRREIRLSETARNLSDDQIQELMYITMRLNSEKESSNTQQYVLGAVEAAKNPEKFNQIWHDGYNRGIATIQYAKETLPADSE